MCKKQFGGKIYCPPFCLPTGPQMQKAEEKKKLRRPKTHTHNPEHITVLGCTCQQKKESESTKDSAKMLALVLTKAKGFY